MLADDAERITRLCDAVQWQNDLALYQWAQLMAVALDFRPDLILELGRGMGNSTCAFTEVANLLQPQRCRVLSLCLSSDWQTRTVPSLKSIVPKTWFLPLEAHQTNILTFDYARALAGHERVLVFWDAHGFDVAECVLGAILPLIADRPHLVAMHDLSDSRYLAPTMSSYDGNRLWRGNDWSGPRLRIGHIDTKVEQAVAVVDFTSRNTIPLHSVDHELHTEFAAHPERAAEVHRLLGDSLFSLNAHWYYFSLNQGTAPFTFPRFSQPTPPARAPLRRRVKVAAKILLGRQPIEN